MGGLSEHIKTTSAKLGPAQKSSAVKFEFEPDLIFSEKLRILQCFRIMASGL